VPHDEDERGQRQPLEPDERREDDPRVEARDALPERAQPLARSEPLRPGGGAVPERQLDLADIDIRPVIVGRG
jgi:hypothetical protein